MGQLEGKVAVITGGGRGIGRAIALRYASEGATVVISSRTAGDLETTLRDAHLGDERSLAVVADGSDRTDARRPVEEALAEFGRIDILVNNVGGGVPGDADPFAGNEDIFEQTLFLNLASAYWITVAALPGMRDRGFGRIINIGSAASWTTGSTVGYTSAKHGLVGFTKELAKSAAPFGINVNIICPGWTQTSALDFNRIAERRGTTVEEEMRRAQSVCLQGVILDPEELTGMATLLASEDGRRITGQVIRVDGGQKV